MKTRILLSLLSALFFTSAPLNAQSAYLIHEDFTDKTNDWYTGSGSNHDISIQNGKYLISTKKGAIWPHIEVFPFEKNHYKLSAEITITKSKKYGSAGLMWGGNDGENFYTLILHDGGYALMKHTATDAKLLTDWTDNAAVKGINETNFVEIEQENGQITFRVNDTELFQKPAFKFFGSNVGIFVEPDVSVSVDNITLSTPEIKLNLAQNASEATKTVLSSAVNTKEDESLAQISPDGEYLYFFRRYHHHEKGSQKEGEGWVSTKSNDSWATASAVQKPINCSKTNFVASVLPDNNTLMAGSRYNDQGEIIGEGFAISTKTTTGWGIPQNLDIKNYSNERPYLEGCLSANQKALIMSLKRPGTKGPSDLYISFALKDGSWSTPKHMGNLNSEGSETYPFLAPDNKTLYFSSNGWPGYGGQDIFMTHRLDDTWTNWSTPKNLGPVINTAHSDCGISVSAKGDKAYISSVSHTTESLDLFEVDLPKSMRPEPVLLIKGKVIDHVTKKPLAAIITIHDLDSDKEVGIAISDPTTGEYEIVLPQGRDYSFYAEKENYFAIRENIPLGQIDAYKEVNQDLELSPINVGEKVKLNNIFFEQARAELLPRSEAELNQLIKLLQDNPSIKIQINGHTDNIGDADLNMELSQKRANSILEYLAKAGIDRGRLSAKGFGGTQPIADNSKPHLRRKNRRVEIVLLDK